MDKQERLKQFINNKITSNIVYETLRDSFLKKRGRRDIYILASERLAVELLDEAWKEIEKYKESNNDKSSENRQIGL